MSRQQRFGLIALAVAVAVVAFIVLRPEDEDEPAPTSAAPAQTAPAQTTTEPTETQTQEEPPEPETTRIRVQGGQPAGGVEQIEVERGETVRLAVSADSPQQVHVHGYDLFGDAAPGSPARFRFEADIEGVFEVELEGAHTQIAELRVEP